MGSLAWLEGAKEAAGSQSWDPVLRKSNAGQALLQTIAGVCGHQRKARAMLSSQYEVPASGISPSGEPAGKQDSGQPLGKGESGVSYIALGLGSSR